MKKTMLVLLALVLVLALLGCECDHEWAEADCVNAAVCANCQETGAAALGHTFSAATCDAPEICTRCGETRGEALGHSFGQWSFGDTEQVRTCETCGAEERQEIDREAHMLHLLAGRWEYYCITMEGREISAIQWPMFSYAQMEENGTFRYVMGLVSQDMTVEFTRYDEAEKCFYGNVITPDGDLSPMTLELREQGNILRTNAGGSMEILYCKYEKTWDRLPGTWGGMTNGTVCYVTLNPDGTFEGDLGGPCSGQWLRMPGKEDGARANGGCMLYFEKDGKMMTVLGEWLDYGAARGEAPNVDVQLILFSGNSTDTMGISRMTADEVDALYGMKEEAGKMILGSWKSKNVYAFDGTNHTPYIFLDRELTIREDGTFTLVLDEKTEGTWIFDQASGSGDRVSYSYRFIYPNAPKDLATVTYSAWSGELNFLYNDGKYSHYIGFENLTQEQREYFLKGPDRLPGTYVSEKVVFTDKGTGEEIETVETGYTITISEDGTYTAELNEPIADQWFFWDLAPEGGHTYAFRVKGSQYESRLTEEGVLIFMHRIDGKFCNIYFRLK